MAKVPITHILNLQNEQQAVGRMNANFDAIQSVIETLLSRDGVAPNQMVGILDMNSRRLINLPMPIDPTDAARFKEIQDFYALVTAERERAEDAADASEISAGKSAASANASAFSAAAALVSEENADLSEAEALFQANRAEEAAIALEIYEIHFFFGGFPYGNETLYSLGTTRPFTLLTDQSNSFAVSDIAATNETSFDILINDTPIGSIVWPALSSVGIISISVDTSFVAGDLLSIRQASMPDISLKDLSISFLARRDTQ